VPTLLHLDSSGLDLEQTVQAVLDAVVRTAHATTDLTHGELAANAAVNR